MIDILTLRFRALINEKHAEFHKEANAMMVKANPKTMGIEPQYAIFKNALDVEVAMLDQVRKSSYTEKIYEQDQVREMILIGLKRAIQSACSHWKSEFREAGKELLLVFDNYGNIRKRAIDQETAAIDDLIDELDSNHTVAMSFLKLGDWTTELGKANAEFQALILGRDEESGGKIKGKMKDAREALDTAFRMVMEQVKAVALTQGEAKVIWFINSINAAITRYKNTLSQVEGRRNPKKDK